MKVYIINCLSFFRNCTPIIKVLDINVQIPHTKTRKNKGNHENVTMILWKYTAFHFNLLRLGHLMLSKHEPRPLLMEQSRSKTSYY